MWRRIALLLFTSAYVTSQLIPSGGAQVKITDQPFAVANAQQLNQIVWTTALGRTAKETIYCVSEPPVNRLRFVCVDCPQKNITDILNVLNSAQDLTGSAGFPTVQLRDVEVNPAWTGVTIICQAALNGGTIDSAPAVVQVRYIRQPHVVDANGQGPVLIANQGLRFYVECIRGPDGSCQAAGRRKTLRCAVDSHPPATSFKWLKNGIPTNGNADEIAIGAEMIGATIQCGASNGLNSDELQQLSLPVTIDPYSAARLVADNFQQVQTTAPFLPGNRVDMNQQISMACQVEGNPRPVVFWKLRRANGQVVDAPCPQGLEGQYREVPASQGQPVQPNIIRLMAICDVRITNYSLSGQYWCSACSYVSQGSPECSPSLETPGERVLNVQVQGAPMQSDTPPSVEQFEGQNVAVVTVHYCAEPMPRPPREVVFSIDGNDIQLGQNWQNFLFEANTQNNTVPNCYFSRLKITPVHEDDQSRQIMLKLQNSYGVKQITVSLGDLLGTDGSEGGVPRWLAYALGVIAVGLLLLLCVIFCMRKQMFCFEGVKTSQAQYPDDKLKPGPTLTHEPYIDDSPRGFYGQGAEVMRGSSTEQVYMSREAVV